MPACQMIHTQIRYRRSKMCRINEMKLKKKKEEQSKKKSTMYSIQNRISSSVYFSIRRFSEAVFVRERMFVMLVCMVICTHTHIRIVCMFQKFNRQNKYKTYFCRSFVYFTTVQNVQVHLPFFYYLVLFLYYFFINLFLSVRIFNENKKKKKQQQQQNIYYSK